VSFGDPWLLATLLALPALVVLYRRAERRRVRYAVRFTNLDVLAAITGERSRRRLVAPVLLLLALGTLCLAVARPRHTVLVPNEQASVILVLDVSRSMEAKDIKPTRLKAAQEAMRRFLDRAPKHLRVGLILFAGEAQVATPPTTDHDLVRQALDNADDFSGFRGTAIGDALALAVRLARIAVPGGVETGPSPIAYVTTPKSPVSILFLSDGHQTRGLLAPLEGAQRAANAGIPVYTVALGTPTGHLQPQDFGLGGNRLPGGGAIPQGFFSVPPDPTTLRAIAQTTGGKFFNARTPEILRSAYDSLGSHLGRTRARQELTSRFVLIAALLLIAAGIASRPLVPRLP
jgi:Ca-activated chloride channel family protein